MKIEEGKMYRLNNGRVVGPMALHKDGWFWTAPGFPPEAWYGPNNPMFSDHEGRQYSNGTISKEDIYNVCV